MQTRALLALAKKQAPDWSEDNLRELLNEVQNFMLMSRPVGLLRVVDPAIGKDPQFTSLSTSYAISATAADDTITVASNSIQTGHFVTIELDGGTAAGLTDEGEYYWIRVSATSGKVATSYANATAGTAVDLSGDAGAGTVKPGYEYEISTANGFPSAAGFVYCVYSDDPSEPEENMLILPADYTYPARICFPDKPGGSKYYVWYYKKPTQVSAVTTALTVPEGYHISHVYEGLMGLVEKMDSGKSDRWDKFEKVLCPRFWYANNDPKFKASSKVTLRGY